MNTPPTSSNLTTPSDREIRLERVFDAPRDRVWRAYTDPELAAQWWGRGNKLVIQRMEVRRGGHWRFVEHTKDGKHGFEGRYRVVEAPERLVYTFEWDGMPGHVIVEDVTFADIGDGRTKVVVTALFHTKEERDGMMNAGMEQGTNQSWATLDRILAAMAGAPSAAAPLARRVKKVAFTMYPVTDVARARKFYEETLGLEVGMAGSHEGMHWVEYDLPGGGCFALTNASDAQPSAGAGGTIALEVEDLEGVIRHLKDEGVTFKGDVIRGPRCRMAMCLDPEGNSLLLHQLDRA